MRGVCVLTITILALVSPVFGQFRPDGQPRPTGYPQTPTEEYGATPRCVDPATSLQVDCEWYGFAHNDYPVTGAQCLVRTRQFMSNSSLIGYLAPYKYYYLTSFIFDKATNTSYCLYGCFKMGATAPTPATPEPNGFAPPPPPVFAPPPPPIAIPPTPVDPAVPAPPTAGTPPATAGTPPALPPPGLYNLSAAGLVRPVMSILSLVVSGALLALNLLCF